MYESVCASSHQVDSSDPVPSQPRYSAKSGIAASTKKFRLTQNKAKNNSFGILVWRSRVNKPIIAC